MAYLDLIPELLINDVTSSSDVTRVLSVRRIGVICLPPVSITSDQGV